MAGAAVRGGVGQRGGAGGRRGADDVAQSGEHGELTRQRCGPSKGLSASFVSTAIRRGARVGVASASSVTSGCLARRRATCSIFFIFFTSASSWPWLNSSFCKALYSALSLQLRVGNGAIWAADTDTTTSVCSARTLVRYAPRVLTTPSSLEKFDVSTGIGS